MQDGFWSVFSETGDVVGYLLCRAAENAGRADGGRKPSAGGGTRGCAIHAPRSGEAAHGRAASASPAAGAASAADGAPEERAARPVSGTSGGGGVSV